MTSIGGYVSELRVVVQDDGMFLFLKFFEMNFEFEEVLLRLLIMNLSPVRAIFSLMKVRKSKNLWEDDDL